MVFLDADVLNKPEIMVSQVASKVDATQRQISDADTRLYIGKQIEALAELTRRRKS